MRELTSSLALFLAASSLAIASSFVRVAQETDIPNELEALIGVANDGGYRSTIEPDSLEACVGNRLCGPGRICCEGVCTVCHILLNSFDVVLLWLKGVRAIEGYDLNLNFWKWRKVDTSQLSGAQV
jgi:hypothetical protein